MKLKSNLLKFAVAPLTLTGALAASMMPANAGIIGSVGLLGVVEFLTPQNDGTFYFADPALCGGGGDEPLDDDCDFGIGDATGIFTFTLGSPLNDGNQFGLPERSPSDASGQNLPSLSLPGTFAYGGVDNSCLLIPTGDSGGIEPDWTCSGNAITTNPSSAYDETLIH